MPLHPTQETQELVSLLSQLLAETYTIFLQTQNFHWNIEGIEFAAIHPFLETQYDEYFQAIDLIAEQIRMLGAKTPGSFAEFTQLSGFAIKPDVTDTTAMLTTLAEQTVKILGTLEAVQRTAEPLSTAVEDLAIERQRAHEKHLWMLESMIK